jgi:hypothetical protein
MTRESASPSTGPSIAGRPGGTSPYAIATDSTSGGALATDGAPPASGNAASGGNPNALPRAVGAAAKPEGFVAGRPLQGPPEAVPPADAQPAAPLRPGEWHPREDQPKPKRENELPLDDKGKREKSKKEVTSLAEKRGRDWGLRDAADRSIPITRPIPVQCYGDRLVLMPDQRTRNEKTVPLEGDTREAIDAFVSAVWDYMDGWGIAGKGMYWRPVLAVEVFPGGEERFAELSQLLQGSGLTVQRKQ